MTATAAPARSRSHKREDSLIGIKSGLQSGLIAIALVASAWFGPSANAQDRAAQLPAPIRALLDGAKKEGTAVIFGQSLNPTQIQQYSDAVSEFYGFKIQLTMISGMHPVKASELAQAMKQGVPSGIDVFWTASEVAETLRKGNALAAIDWVKETGADPKLVWGKDGLRAHDGTLAMVGYNTQLVPAKDAPRSYLELVNPAWKGRLAMPRTATPFTYISYYLGDEKTETLLRDLMDKVQPKILATFPDLRTRLISGEFALELGSEVFRDRLRGAPVEHAPIDPLVVTPWGTYVMSDAQHPNIAKLWGYWLATPNGQKTMSDITGVSRADAEGTEFWKFAQGKRTVIVPEDFTRDIERLSQKYAKLMGIAR
jgi:iron(III) transport system substrate-binding protein